MRTTYVATHQEAQPSSDHRAESAHVLSSLALSASLLCLCLTPAERASAAGLEFPDSGSHATVRGGASVSGINDPTAGFLNPALLSRLGGFRVSYNHNLISSFIRFDRQQSMIADGYSYEIDPEARGEGLGSGENQDTLFPLNGLLALSYQIQPNLTVGLSVHGPNGSGGSQYPVQGGQRYMMTSLEGLLAFVGGSVAYGGSNWGVGTTLQLATMPEMKYRMVIDGTPDADLNPNLSAFDVEAEVSVSDPVAFTALVGAWYRPTPSFEVAVSGRILPVNFNAQGNVSVENTPNETVFGDEQLLIDGGSAAFDFTLPQTARLGFRYRHLESSTSREEETKERFDVELALVYERWSVMDTLEIELEGMARIVSKPLIDVSIEKRWRDTLSARLGGTYHVNDALSLSAGSFFEQGATPRQYAHIDFPSYDRFGVAGGVAYRVTTGVELIVGYLHIFEHSVTVSESEAKVFQQRPIRPCDSEGGCGENSEGVRHSGVPANAGKHTVSFQNITLGVNATF